MIEKTKLPLTLKLPMPFKAHVYPSPNGGRGATVKGKGRITLVFEATDDPNIAKVRIEDIWLKLQPSRIAFDIDHDGELECIEIPAWKLGTQHFDLESSCGQYNLKSKHISLNLIFSLDKKELHPLVAGVAGLDAKPVRFEIVERGWLDLETGTASTHSRPFTIPEGPFAGLTIMGGQFDEQCDANVTLGVVVAPAGEAVPDIPPGQAPEEIWICPNTPIVLLWNSSNADNVEISPDLGVRDPSGYQRIPGTTPDGDTLSAIDRNLEYIATTRGSCNSASDRVSVHVVIGTEEIPQIAEYNDFYGYWNCNLPSHTYDESILVDEIIIDTVNPSDGTVRTDSISHTRWRMDHVYSTLAPTGTTIPSLDTWHNTAASFPIPGSYRFTPIDPTTGDPLDQFSDDEKKLKVYFRLKAHC